jgi:CBS domain-containing protein
MSTFCPSCGAWNLEGADQCTDCGADLYNVGAPPAVRIDQAVMRRPLSSLELTTVHSISPDETMDVAAQTLRRQKVDFLEVVENGQLIGVLSVRDIVARVGPDYHEKLRRPVREFMTPRPETLPPDAPISFALNMMDVGGYRHVPVTQDAGRILGVVSSRDVLTYIVKHSREQVATEGVTTSHGVRK